MRNSASGSAPYLSAPPLPRFTARHGAFAAVAPGAAAAVIAAPGAAAAREVKGGEVCCCVGAAATARNGVASRTSADWRERRVSSCVVSSGRVLSALPQGGRPALRTEPMLDLEVVPERSLGNEQWEFTLGEWGPFKTLSAGPCFSLDPSTASLCPRCRCVRGSPPFCTL